MTVLVEHRDALVLALYRREVEEGRGVVPVARLKLDLEWDGTTTGARLASLEDEGLVWCQRRPSKPRLWALTIPGVRLARRLIALEANP